MQAVTCAISVGLVLILLGLVVLLSLTAGVVADRVRESLAVTVVLDDDAHTREAKRLLDSLSCARYVGSIDYISREQALQEQIESMGIDPTDFLGANPFSISMEVKVRPEYACSDSLQQIASELRASPLVSDVLYERDLVESLNRGLHRVSLFLLAVALLLVVISVSLIGTTVRLSVLSHRVVLHTMKLVGAKWSFIRRPLLVRAFWIGIVSALMADAAILGGVYWASAYDAGILHYVTLRSIALTIASVHLIGLVLMLVCTYISVTHCLKMRGSDLY